MYIDEVTKKRIVLGVIFVIVIISTWFFSSKLYFNEGYQAGYDCGKEDGYRMGLNQTCKSSYDKAFSEGYKHGYEVGFSDGCNASKLGQC